MIVKNIVLENWKKFRDPVEFEFSEGINIIYGDNECGKSTVIDSLRTTIFSKHTSKSQKVKATVPWNSNLSPKASIEFHIGGKLYRLTKRFMQQESILEIMNNDLWERIGEGDVADKEVVAIIGGELPRTGDTKPQNWGLGQSLWMVQGDPIIKDELNQETVTSLQSMIGASIESDDEKNVLKNIDQLYSNIFTKTGKQKKSSMLYTVEEDIEQIQSKLNSAKNNLMQKEELVRGLEDGELNLQRNIKSLKETGDVVEKLQHDVEEAKKHELERSKVESELKTLKTEFKTLKDKIDEIKLINNSNDELISDNEEEIKNLKYLEKEKETLAGNISVFNNKIIDVKTKIEEYEYEKRFASIALTTIKEEIELENKYSILKEVEELEEYLIKQEKELSSFISPNKTELKVAEQLNNKIRNNEAQLDAIGLSIKSTGLGNVSGSLILDGKNEEFELNENDGNSWKAHQSVNIVIKDLINFEIKSGSHDVEELRTSLEDMKLKYRSQLDSYKCVDLDGLRDAITKNKILTDDINRTKNVLNKKFKNGKISFLKEIGELEGKIQNNWNIIPKNSRYKLCEQSDKNISTSLLSNKINKLEEEIIVFKTQNTDFENHLNNLQEEVKNLEEKVSILKSHIHGNNQVIKNNSERLVNIEKDGFDINERERKLDEASVDLDRKERTLKFLSQEVEEKEEKPLKTYKVYEEKFKRLEKDIQVIELSKVRNETEIENLMRNTDDVNKIEELLELQKKNLDDLRIEAEASKLLYDLTDYYHETTITSLTSPIEKLVTENLRKLIGPKYCVEFGNNAKPSCVIPEGRENHADLDMLSFGTQEQIWCLFRLALGQLLGTNEKQLVVLDDPFVNTDPTRLHHALDIIEESSKNLQIIILTCNIDDYELLPDANLISIL